MSNTTIRKQLLKRQKDICPICQQSLANTEDWAIRIDRHPIKGQDGGKYKLGNTRAIHLECDWKLEGNRPNSPKPHLLTAYRSYKTFQALANDMDRRIKAYQGQAKNTTVSPYIDEEDLAEMETIRDKLIEITHEKFLKVKRMVRKEPEWKAIFKKAPGCTELTAALLLGKIDIAKAETISALWRFLGYDHTERTKTGKKVIGKGVAYKSPLYASVGSAAIRGNKYRQDYDRIKAKYEAQEKKGHYLAVNQTIKLWLSHLWVKWRAYEGLPITEPYVIKHLLHDPSSLITPESRGWDEE